MFLKIFNSIKNFLFISVPYPYKAEFDLWINSINAARAKIIAITFAFIEALILATAFGFKKGSIFEKPNIYFWIMYIIFFAVMIIYSFIFIRLGRNPSCHVTGIRVAVVSLAASALLWCAGISLLDQLTTGQVIVYTVAIVAIAVTPIFKPITFLIMYLSTHILFIIMLPYFQKSGGLLYSNYINSTSFLIISWAIAYVRYKKQVEDFNNRKLIQSKTDELNQKNRELEEAYLKLEILSKTDCLTGIYNRLVFDSTIEAEWNRCKRYMMPLSLVMIDIDFFKEFNDNYGHQIGDDCIKSIAAVISSCVKRSTDTVARYGGDEFTIILPCTEKEDALSIAEQIKKMVEEIAIPHRCSPISEFVTISVGVNATVPSGGANIKEFVKSADRALYEAKKNRNDIVVA